MFFYLFKKNRGSLYGSRIARMHTGAKHERTVYTFCQHYLHGAGVATPDPGEAPPMAGICMRSHFILKIIMQEGDIYFVEIPASNEYQPIIFDMSSISKI